MLRWVKRLSSSFIIITPLPVPMTQGLTLHYSSIEAEIHQCFQQRSNPCKKHTGMWAGCISHLRCCLKIEIIWTDPNLLNQIWAGVGGGLVGNLEVHGCNSSENTVITSDINNHMTLKPGLIGKCAHDILMKV